MVDHKGKAGSILNVHYLNSVWALTPFIGHPPTRHLICKARAAITNQKLIRRAEKNINTKKKPLQIGEMFCSEQIKWKIIRISMAEK